MPRLFVYGSLMFDEVRRKLGIGRLVSAPARLAGYRRAALRGETYPAVVANPDAFVDGVLVSGLDAADLRRLDRFEGRLYRRVAVSVTSAGRSCSADAYVLRDQYRRHLADGDWCGDTFRDRHLKAFLRGYSNWQPDTR